MTEPESERRAVIDCCLREAKMSRNLAALALTLGVLFFAPSSGSIAKPPAPFPECDVTIESVRVLPPGGAHEFAAVPFDQLDPAVQKTMRTDLQDPEVRLYEVLKNQTIHLGDPQLVHIGPGEEFEFRRVGILGGSVECASLVDGVVIVSGSRSLKELAEDPSLCSSHGFNSDVYVVAWVRKETPVPTR
jgi:hypothetical protein